MRFKNISPSPIENVSPGAVGPMANGAFARHLERLGMIEILDGEAANAPLPAATPAAISSLVVERDGLLRQLELAKTENAALAESASQSGALRDQNASLLAQLQAAGGADLAAENAGLKAQVAALEADLAKATEPKSKKSS